MRPVNLDSSIVSRMFRRMACTSCCIVSSLRCSKNCVRAERRSSSWRPSCNCWASANLRGKELHHFSMRFQPPIIVSADKCTQGKQHNRFLGARATPLSQVAMVVDCRNKRRQSLPFHPETQQAPEIKSRATKHYFPLLPFGDGLPTPLLMVVSGSVPSDIRFVA